MTTDTEFSPDTVVSILRAMAKNYKDGHAWDRLDAEVCRQAADYIDSNPPVAGIPGNVITHRYSWRKALEIALAGASTIPPDMDDRAYWEHELAAFDRTFDKLQEMVVAKDKLSPVDAPEPAWHAYRYKMVNGFGPWHLYESKQMLPADLTHEYMPLYDRPSPVDAARENWLAGYQQATYDISGRALSDGDLAGIGSRYLGPAKVAPVGAAHLSHLLDWLENNVLDIVDWLGTSTDQRAANREEREAREKWAELRDALTAQHKDKKS